MVIVVTYGAMVTGQALSFAPDYAAAKVSAARIFKLFDYKPAIDAYSDEGIKPVSFVLFAHKTK